MEFETKKIIKNLEEQIEKAYNLPIFKGYTAINKRGVEKLIDEIYSNLPVDVMKARVFLKEHNLDIPSRNNTDFDGKTIYDYLKELETYLDNSFCTLKYVIIKINAIEKLLNKIYGTIPEEIQKAQIADKK